MEERATLVANLNPREQGRTREHRGVQKIKKEKQCNKPTKIDPGLPQRVSISNPG